MRTCQKVLYKCIKKWWDKHLNPVKQYKTPRRLVFKGCHRVEGSRRDCRLLLTSGTKVWYILDFRRIVLVFLLCCFSQRKLWEETQIISSVDFIYIWSIMNNDDSEDVWISALWVSEQVWRRLDHTDLWRFRSSAAGSQLWLSSSEIHDVQHLI